MARRPRRMPRPLGFHWDARDPIIRPDGLPPCRWCKGPVRRPRRNWCGRPECVWEWQRRTDFDLTRRAVLERDRGICALCGLDALAAARAFRDALAARVGYDAALALLSRRPGPPGSGITPETARGAALALAAEHSRLSGLPAWSLLRGQTAEVDHITPVCEGGDYFALSNLRTLCSACHARETRALNARRREARKAKGRRRAG